MKNVGDLEGNGINNVKDIVGRRARAANGKSYPSMAKHNRSKNPVRKSSYGRYLSRILFSLFLFCFVIGLAVYIGFTMLQGKAINNDRLTSQLQSVLQESVGEQFFIDVDNTEVKIQSFSQIDLVANKVTLTSKKTDMRFADIEKISVSVEPLTMLAKVPRFGELVVKDARLDLAALKTSAKFEVNQIKKPLAQLGNYSAMLNGQFERKLFRSIKLSNVKLSNIDVADTSKFVTVQSATLGKNSAALELQAEMVTAHSKPRLFASWSGHSGQKTLSVSSHDISAREWLNAPNIGENAKFGLGSDAIFETFLTLNFDDQNKPLASTVNISSQQSTLKIGKFKSAQVDALSAFIKLLPNENRVELSELSAKSGSYNFKGVGAAVPLQIDQGFSGPIELNLSAAESGDGSIGLSISGVWNNTERLLEFSNVEIRSADDLITGVGHLAFSKPSPNNEQKTLGVKLNLTSDRFAIESLKRAWPFFLASSAKKWVVAKVRNGEITNATAQVNIPIGKIGTMRSDGGFTKDQIQFETKLHGIEVDTFGELPAVKKLEGVLTVGGNALFANADSGEIVRGKYKPAALTKLTVDFPKLIAEERSISLNVGLSGRASTLSNIANAKPIRAASRAKINPQALSGNANIDLVAKFNLLPGAKVSNLTWNLIGDLQNVSSKEKLFSRSVKKANMLLEATAQSVRLKGDALVDGVKADILLVEPLSKSSSVKRVQKFSTAVSDESLAKLGIDVRPVLNGKIGIEQSNQGAARTHMKMDLTQTDVSLPWIGWLKGKGIKAKAEFNITQSKGVSKLSKLKVRGSGFDATGFVEFDKSGLRKASLKDVTLVGDENFNVEISRAKSRYNISVSGQKYDARSLINLLFHERDDTGENGEVDVTVKARFKSIKGFGNQVLSNATIAYQTIDGLVSSINIEGTISNGKKTSLVAKRQQTTTNFDIKSDDAGALLSFVDIYRNATGGTMVANLSRIGNGPFVGRVKMRGFTVTGEERLSAFSRAPAGEKKFKKIPGEIKKINTGSITFRKAEALITKSPNRFHLQDGIIRSNEIGFTFEGDLYDQNNQMNIRGTFMPLIAVSRLVGLIPFIGQIFSNGKDTALLGITYQLKGNAKSPKVLVNPISLVAPGIFNEVFEFQN